MLAELDAGPIVTLNHAVAVAMVHGPEAGLVLLGPLGGGDRMRGHHHLRAHLREMAGDHEAALAGYRTAAQLTASLPERQYLHGRVTRRQADL
jgi:predicted RNA polymerase sigma factor